MITAKAFFPLVKYFQCYYKGPLLFITIPDKISLLKLFSVSSVGVCQLTFKNIFILKNKNKTKLSLFHIPFILVLY